MDDNRQHKITISGDQIVQHNSGPGTAIGKVVNSAPSAAVPEEAVGQFQELVAHLRRAGLIDEHGGVRDESALRTEVTAQGGRLDSIRAAVVRGGGPALQSAVGGTAAGIVVRILIDLFS